MRLLQYPDHRVIEVTDPEQVAKDVRSMSSASWGAGPASREGGKATVFVCRKALLPVIQEDDPEWDCRTMGNKICGPTTEGATAL